MLTEHLFGQKTRDFKSLPLLCFLLFLLQIGMSYTHITNNKIHQSAPRGGGSHSLLMSVNPTPLERGTWPGS